LDNFIFLFLLPKSNLSINVHCLLGLSHNIIESEVLILLLWETFPPIVNTDVVRELVKEVQDKGQTRAFLTTIIIAIIILLLQY